MAVSIEDYYLGLEDDLWEMAETTDYRQADLVQGIVGVSWCGQDHHIICKY